MFQCINWVVKFWTFQVKKTVMSACFDPFWWELWASDISLNKLSCWTFYWTVHGALGSRLSKELVLVVDISSRGTDIAALSWFSVLSQKREATSQPERPFCQEPRLRRIVFCRLPSSDECSTAQWRRLHVESGYRVHCTCSGWCRWSWECSHSRHMAICTHMQLGGAETRIWQHYLIKWKEK